MIEKGQAWGERRIVPTGMRVVGDDLALHEWVVTHRQQGRPIGEVAIGGGDLARTVAGGARIGHEATYAPLDVVHLAADGDDVTWAATHVVARRSWWRGEVLLAMNAEHLGDYDVAPRAHPNDGLLDIVRVDPSMGWRARRQARQRARLGTHLPHPQLTVSRRATHSVRFARPLVVWVDGVRWRQATTLDLTVEVDAYHAYF